MSSPRAVRFLDRTTPPHVITLILIAGVATLSMNIFLPSLPTMTEYFQTDYRLMQLSVSVYLAFSAILQVIVGPLSDRFGRRPVILVGMAIFTVASVGCVFATTIETFLALRMIQASVITGMALGRAAVRDMVPQDQAASMIGYVTMGMAVVPMISPAIGGWLGGTFGWQSTFWFMGVAGGLTYFLVFFDLGETNLVKSSSFSEQFSQYPEVLGSTRFWGYSLAATFGSGAFFAFLGGAPFVGSVIYGLEEQAIGLYIGAPALGYLTGNFISGRYSVRYGINRMILVGGAILSIGMTCLLLTYLAGLGSAIVFFAFMTLVGLGNGLLMPNSNAGLLSVRPHLAGSASGLGGAIMIGGGAGLSAIAGLLLTPETGAFPLIWIMLLTSLCSLASILVVIRRDQELLA